MQAKSLFREAEVTRSLSNLYKPWLINNENARLIDSDAFAVDIIKKSLKARAKERRADADGFTEGLVADDIEDFAEPEEEVDYVALAKEEAERILTEANSRSAELIRQAQEQRESVLEAAREEGYQNGQSQMQQELAQQKSLLEKQFFEKSERLQAEYTEKHECMERDLVDVILEVFQKVFLIQIEDKKDLLISLINNAILHIEGVRNFRIRVSDDNVLFVENHKENILDRVGHDIGLEIVADSALAGSDCVIETDAGVFECSLGVQLENLIKDIRSLSLDP